MRVKPSGFFFAAFAGLGVGLAAFGQTSGSSQITRTFNFAHTSGVQNINEIATAIRTIVDTQPPVVDVASRSVTVRAAGDRMALAEWLFNGMDLASPVAANSAIHEFRLAGSGDNIVRLFYLNRGQTVQEFQELATLVRTIGDVRRVYTTNEGKILALRGTADQTAMADWLIPELEKSAGQPRAHSVSSEYRLPTIAAPQPNENVMRVFYVGNAATIQSFQEAATLIRTMTDIRRVYTSNAPRAVAVRGTADQVALAAWLFDEIDKPAAGALIPPSRVNHYQSSADADAVRVYYLPHIATVADLQKTATQVRSEASIPRIYTYNAPRILALRANADQIAHADRLLKQLDPADFPAAR
ncbi:MAG TPA: hypothetical protein VIY49_32180 [Bryobacteraceae bacterium]